MLKPIFLKNIQYSLIHKIFLLTATLFPLMINGGCSGTSIYVPNEKATSTIIIKNPIYEPGFYVELDKKEAGFLKEKIRLRVRPGKHRLKFFNTETTICEGTRIITHTFKRNVHVKQYETKNIILSWDDPGYNSREEIKTESMRERAERREKAQEKRQEMGRMPGQPY